MPRPIILLTLLALCSAPATAAEPNKKSRSLQDFERAADVHVKVVPDKARAGETVAVRLTITPKGGGYTYPAFPADAAQARNTLDFPAPGDLIFIGKVSDPPVVWEKKPRPGAAALEEDEYTHKPLTWEFKAVVSPDAKPGPKSFPLKTVTLQACDEGGCYTITGRRSEVPPAEFSVEAGASDRVNPTDLAEAMAKLPPRPKDDGTPPSPIRTGNGSERTAPSPTPPSATAAKSETRKEAKPLDAYTSELKAIATTVVPADVTSVGTGEKDAGLWAFIATAAAWGLISLVTPCVFPMIPITVSIFLHKSQGSLRERMKLAGVYSLTIITVLGVSAFALLKFMAWLSAHPVTNLLLAALFLVLALSLFGMYELTLPNSLQKRLQAKQSQGGVVGTIFGALAFTVISFTCVAPFLGGFAGISAGNDGSGSLVSLPTWKEIAGGLAFATAFAAPFFVLALVPGLMKALPKSGGWLDSVKVVMGFLELAAALKFLRTAELRVFPTPQYFTYDLVLGGWVAISAACGLYLLNVFRLPHDEEKPNIGVPRLLFALLFLGLALYLAPALIKNQDGKAQRPSGAVYAWVEAFLLPEATEEGWRTDLKDTLEAAKKSGKPVFVDFTGKTCTNCKYNESTVFPQLAVREQLEQFERVQLYADEVPAIAYATDPGHDARVDEALTNRDFQLDVFKDSRLPLYAILIPQPDGNLKMFKYPEGKINDPAKFAAFLKAGLAQTKPKK